MQLAHIQVLKWFKNGPQTCKIAQISWFFASFWVWHAAYVHAQRRAACPMSRRGPNVITCNLVRIGDATSQHTSTQMRKKKGNQPQDGRFWHFSVCCKTYVHREHHVTQMGHNVIACNFACIGDATSPHTSAQMVQNGSKTSKIAKISWYFASLRVWHAAYVRPQHHVTCVMS